MIFGQLHQSVRQAYRKVFGGEPPKFTIEPAKHTMFGDFSTNIALMAATTNKMTAIATAQAIVKELERSTIFRNVSVTTPGFINFTITNDHLSEVVRAVIKSPDSFGRSDLGKETRVLVEFVSANPTGPLSLANGRGAFVGEAISRVLELYGCTVMREYYVNDRGGQIESLGHSVLKDGQGEYSGDYIDKLSKRIKEKDVITAGQVASSIIMEEYIKPTLRRLGIEFHQFFSENSLHQTGVYKKVIEILRDRQLIYEADGAIWIATTRFGDKDDRVLVKKDGQETYLASDIAYHAYKIQRGYHRLINVIGADHFEYSRYLSMIIEGALRDHFMWGGKLDWVVTQMVRLIGNGKEVKMSKRAGTAVDLDLIIDEVGADVARFIFLSKTVDSHLDFDLNLAKSNSSQNPVFYVQYAYARISSIFRQFSKNDDFNVPDKITITDPLERQLLLKVIQFPDLVEDIAGDLAVHKLSHYVLTLANSVHTFYERLRVYGESEQIAQSRLAILKATSLTIKKVLDTMGITAPSRMVKQ